MKNFRLKVIAYGLMVLFTAAAAPIIVEATCPQIAVSCPDGRFKSCSGSDDGQGGCTYKKSCLGCGSAEEIEEDSVS